MTSLGDDARETLTIAGLERPRNDLWNNTLRLRAPQTWKVLCASVDQLTCERRWTRAVSPRLWKLVP